LNFSPKKIESERFISLFLMKKITPQYILFWLLALLAVFLLSPWVKFSFAQNHDQKQEKNQTFTLLPWRRQTLQNITWTIVQMPDPNFVLSYLDSLENSPQIDIQTYELTEKRVKSWIKQKAQSWTHFRIMLENNKYHQFQNTFKKLQNERSGLQNIKLISDEHLPTTYLHSKITLAQSGFWIQSSNLTHSTFANNREHLFRSQEPQVLSSLKTLFQKDFSWDTLLATDLHPNLVVCNINCRAIITDLLSSAKKSITIETQYLTDPQLFDIIAKKSKNLTFRAILSDTDNNKKLPKFFWTSQVRLLKKPYVHTKMILIDDEILLLGSMNLSANSLDNNREIWILLLDPALITQFKNEFAQDRKLAEKSPVKRKKRK